MLSCVLRRRARGLHASLCSGYIRTGFALSAASSGCSKQRARSAFSRVGAYLLLLTGSLASVAASAQVSHPDDPPGAVLTLAQAEHELLRRNPSIAEAQKLRQALTHQAIAMAQLPDPQLGLMAQNVPVGSLSFAQGPNAMLSVGVSQEFPPFGERAAKGQLGQSRTNAQYFGLLATRAQKLLALRQIWATAVYDRHAIAVLRHQQHLAQASLGAAIARVRAGDGTEADALRAQAAVLSLWVGNEGPDEPWGRERNDDRERPNRKRVRIEAHYGIVSLPEGKLIGVSDGDIATIAVAHGLAVATCDTGPFIAAGVPMISPWDAG